MMLEGAEGVLRSAGRLFHVRGPLMLSKPFMLKRIENIVQSLYAAYVMQESKSVYW